MIKFFRHIRKSFLMENKTGKYFKYAIGEIVLVVIGILIALQINNWNENRKTNLKSQVYIEKIISDLVKDTININALIKNCNTDKTYIDNYFTFFNQGNIPIDQLIDSSRNISARFFRYIPVNHTFSDMQASGNSNLLKENQRDAIIQLEAEQEQLIIINEKIIDIAIEQATEKSKYLGYPDDFYKKLNRPIDEKQKTQWLIHQHQEFINISKLYLYLASRGNLIKEMSKNTIQILKNNSDD